MTATLTTKLGIDDREFSEGLEHNARKYKVFGRELNEISLGFGKSMGESAKSIGKLGEGFKIAGAAAGIFAGADGLLGIAGSLASGGLVLGGMAALSFAMNKFEQDAEAAKDAVAEYVKALGKIPHNEKGLGILDSATHSIQSGITQAQRKIEDLTAKNPASIAAGNTGAGMGQAGQGLMEIWNWLTKIKPLQGTIDVLEQELDATNEASSDLGNELNTEEGRVKTFTERFEKLEQVLSAMNGAVAAGVPRETFLSTYLRGWETATDLVRAHGVEIGKIGDMARKLYTDFKNTPLFDLGSARVASANAQAIMGGLLSRPQQIPTTRAPKLGEVQIGNFVVPAPHEAFQLMHPRNASDEQKTLIDDTALSFDKLKLALESLGDSAVSTGDALKTGFQSAALAAVDQLASIFQTIAQHIGGGGGGAQFGSAIGSAFGGAFAGAHFGLALGPLGAGLGAIGGALIGGLFDGHTKAVNNSADALNSLATAAQKVNEAISNLPAGIKVAAYRYAAATPSHGNQNPLTGDPFTPGSGAGSGGSGGSGFQPTAGGGIHADVMNLHLYGVKDVASLVRQIGAKLQSANGRGGASAMKLATLAGG